jgi:maltoporin
MTANASEWAMFCGKAAAVMRDARLNKITLEQASQFFETDQTISNPDLRRYAEYIIWEIDGSPDSYQAFLEMFEKRIAEQDFVRYLAL